MDSVSGVSLRPFESWGPTAFLVAGVVLLGYAALKGLELATGMLLPDVLKVTVGHLGLLVPVVGLLGLYSAVRERSPILSLVGAGSSVVSGVCSMVLIVSVFHLTLTMEGYPAIPEDAGQGLLPGMLGPLLLVLSIVTLLVGFLLLGAATLQTDAIPRPTGYLLFVPVVMWTALFAMIAVGVDGSVAGIVVYGPIAASLLSVGYRLRADSRGTEDRSSFPNHPAA